MSQDAGRASRSAPIPMPVIPLHPTALRLGHPIPVALRDASGHLLMPRGTMLADESQRQQLIARGIYVDANDSEQFRKAMAGKLDSMLRSNALLGQIAKAVPDAADCGPAASPRSLADPIAAWNDLLVRASALLHASRPSASIRRAAMCAWPTPKWRSCCAAGAAPTSR